MKVQSSVMDDDRRTDRPDGQMILLLRHRVRRYIIKNSRENFGDFEANSGHFCPSCNFNLVLKLFYKVKAVSLWCAIRPITTSYRTVGAEKGIKLNIFYCSPLSTKLLKRLVHKWEYLWCLMHWCSKNRCFNAKVFAFQHLFFEPFLWCIYHHGLSPPEGD